jgi:hypothetical protein
MSRSNPAWAMLQRILDRLLPELMEEDLDALFLAVQLERCRRRHARRRNPEAINPL